MMRALPFVLLGTVALTSFARAEAPAPASVEDALADADLALRRAYQKEYAVLEAEKRALRQRAAELDADAARRREAARADLLRLESELTALSLAADHADKRLSNAEQQRDVATGAADALDAILSQAGVEAPEDATGEPAAAVSPELLRAAFAKSLAARADQMRVHVEDGAFFDVHGKKVDGRVLHVGSVAALGEANGEAGALAPAGGGLLKRWPDADDVGAAGLFAGERPATVGLFLYESLDKAVEPPRSKTALEVVKAGGVIAWVIVGLGLLAALLVTLRALLLWRAGAGAERLVDEVPALVLRGAKNEALELCRRSRGAMGRVLAAAVRTLDREREERTDRIDEAILHELQPIDRFGTMILVFAGVAPLLGLLGTVTGMIATFDAITEHGTGDPRLLSGGISEALITTELGLIVAIPALLLGNVLSGVGERLKRRLDAGALRVSNLAEDTTPPEAPHLVDRRAA